MKTRLGLAMVAAALAGTLQHAIPHYRSGTGQRKHRRPRGASVPSASRHPPGAPQLHLHTADGKHKFYELKDLEIARLSAETRGGILEHLNGYGQVARRERFRT